MKKHTKFECTQPCTKQHCMFCEGGLFLCTVCGQAEGDLEPECPGGHIDIVFDGPPGPTPGRFVEVEDRQQKSISFGEWVQRTDGYWVLRLRGKDFFTHVPEPADDAAPSKNAT